MVNCDVFTPTRPSARATSRADPGSVTPKGFALALPCPRSHRPLPVATGRPSRISLRFLELYGWKHSVRAAFVWLLALGMTIWRFSHDAVCHQRVVPRCRVAFHRATTPECSLLPLGGYLGPLPFSSLGNKADLATAPRLGVKGGNVHPQGWPPLWNPDSTLFSSRGTHGLLPTEEVIATFELRCPFLTPTLFAARIWTPAE